LINGLKLKDAWDPNKNPFGFTHYTATGATRIDRMYLSEDLIRHKQGTETIAAAFTDHLAVLFRIQLATPRTLRGKGRWIMNTSFMEDPSFRWKLPEEWKEWTKTIKRYLDITQRWTQFVKKRIKRLFIQEGTEQNSNRRRMEDFYYGVIYDIVRQAGQNSDKMTKLNCLKAKIIRLNNTYQQRVMLNNSEQDRAEGETPTIHHIIKSRKRQETRTIDKLRDDNDEQQETSKTIMKAFTNHFQRALQPIDVQAESMKESLHLITQIINPELNDALMAPIVLEELKTAISQGKPNKAPGVDGIGLEFYRMGLDTVQTELLQIMNIMYSEQPLRAHRARGLIVCIPKRPNHTRISDYRPLTLLNSDYKILARVIAYRLKPILQDIISPQQHCGIQVTSIFEAVATIRDVIAYAETSQTSLCVISLDFQAAFDRISHQYLVETLRAYGFSESFIRRIMGLYRIATSEIHISGFR